MVFLILAIVEIPLFLWLIFRVLPRILVVDSSRVRPEDARRVMRRTQIFTLVVAGGFTELGWILLALFYPT